MEKTNLSPEEILSTDTQKLACAHRAIGEIFQATDLDYLRVDLWLVFKAIITKKPFSFSGEPSTVLCLEKTLLKIITACRSMLEIGESAGDDLSIDNFHPFSEQQIAVDRQYLRELRTLNDRYNGMIRRLTLAETERPVLVIKRFFGAYSYQQWQQILSQWVEYGLSKTSICEGDDECIEVIQYELLESLLEAVYLIWGRTEQISYQKRRLLTTSTSKSVIELLVAALEPELIFEITHLVPSPTEQSPYRDLLIVLPDSNHQPFKDLEPAIELITVRDEKLGCSVRKLSDLRQALENGLVYFILACTEENLIYQGKATQLPRTSSEKANQLIEKSRMNFVAGLTRARKFFYGSCYYEETKETALCMFMLQQATETVFRTIAVSLYGSEKKTHSIRSLKKFNHRLAPELNEILPGGTPDEERLLQLLEDAYLETRYNLQYQISKEDVEVISSRVVRLLEQAELIFEGRMQSAVRTAR